MLACRRYVLLWILPAALIALSVPIDSRGQIPSVLPGQPSAGSSSFFNLDGMNYVITGFDRFKPESKYRDNFQYKDQIKFNISVKYNILDLHRTDEEEISYSEVSGFYFHYRQKSLWNIYDGSSPFYDNNYMPGVSLNLRAGDFQWTYNRLDSLGIPQSWNPSLGIGVSHESNGRDTRPSLLESPNRSWNRAFVGVGVGAPRSTPVSGGVTLWHSFGLADENSDMDRFAGRGQIDFYLAPDGFGDVSAHVSSQILGKSFFTNVEVNLLYPLGKLIDRFRPSFMIQFFHGYGENMLNYGEKHTNVRVGIALIR